MSKYTEPYQRAVREHGAGFKATLWQTPERQKLRWDVFIDMCADNIFGHHTVLDVGCGDGGLLTHLQEEIGNPYYVGIDAIPEQIEKAKADHTCNHSNFILGDFMDNPKLLSSIYTDWGMVSGTLNNYRQSDAMQLMTEVWMSCERGIVFNFLCESYDWEGTMTEGIYPHDPIAWIRWARSLCRRVEYRQDYLYGADGTIFMVK